MVIDQNSLRHRHLDQATEVLSHLGPDVVAQLLTAAADVVLLIDSQGVICDLAFSGDEPMAQGCQQWRGKPWVQTVTVESQPKVQALLSDTDQDAAALWRHINHTLPDGSDLPLAYSVVRVGSDSSAKRGAGVYSVAFARDLRPQVTLQQRLVTAQLSMERDYWRLRQAETRYRLLFQLASEPVLILDGALDKITEINPAAQALLGEKTGAGSLSLSDRLEPASLRTLREMLERLRSTGRSEPVLVRLSSGQAFMASASQFREDQSLQYLLRLCTQAGPATPVVPSGNQLLARIMEQAPDAMAVTDLDGRIMTVNQAFVDLAELGNADLGAGRTARRLAGPLWG
jgi:transcriptional regulator PpsR